jgi:hypothetical protein
VRRLTGIHDEPGQYREDNNKWALIHKEAVVERGDGSYDNTSLFLYIR